MTIKLIAAVRRTTGKTRHSVGTLVEEQPTRVADVETPNKVEIVEMEGSFLLLRFSALNVCVADTWHATIEEAKRQAEFEYGILVEDWIPSVST